MLSITSLIKRIEFKLARRNGSKYIKYLRKKGVIIGKDCFIPRPDTCDIDLTRPSLITIGDKVRLNMGFTLMTHDFASSVIRHVYKDFVGSSGAVSIGNNVYFARNCTVLRGVTIGDNCIIGFGSIVTKNIPENSVVAGIPAKVICTLEEYYRKIKDNRWLEVCEYSQSIVKRFDRKPTIADFIEEFPYFVDGKDSENKKWKEIPIKFQLDSAYYDWSKMHEAKFKSFEEFIISSTAQ